VTVIEHRPRAGDRETAYVVDEVEAMPGGRVFLVAKHPDEKCDRADEVYEVFVGGDLHACNCKGSQCRRHGIVCRHVAMIQHVIEQGAI
jgi:hypothetical protein